VTGRRIAPADDGAGIRPEPAIIITVDHQPVPVLPGETLAAALIAAGYTSWRTTRSGRPRGLFCGIGVCFDCLVTVNGVAGERACIRPARAGDAITTHPPEGPPRADELGREPS
jgi:hypothetical protein